MWQWPHRLLWHETEWSKHIAGSSQMKALCPAPTAPPHPFPLVRLIIRLILECIGAPRVRSPAAGKIVFLRPFKGKKKAQTVWDAVWIDAASKCSLVEVLLVAAAAAAGQARHCCRCCCCRWIGMLLLLPLSLDWLDPAVAATTARHAAEACLLPFGRRDE